MLAAGSCIITISIWMLPSLFFWPRCGNLGISGNVLLFPTKGVGAIRMTLAACPVCIVTLLRFLLICRLTSHWIDLKLGRYTCYGAPQLLLAFDQTTLIPCCFLTSDYSSNFWAYTDKAPSELRSILVGKLILEIPIPGGLLVIFPTFPGLWLVKQFLHICRLLIGLFTNLMYSLSPFARLIGFKSYTSEWRPWFSPDLVYSQHVSNDAQFHVILVNCSPLFPQFGNEPVTLHSSCDIAIPSVPLMTEIPL